MPELASITDINVHLPVDKVQILDGEDSDLQIDAYRLIRSRLTGTYTSNTIATWVSYATTPEQIRRIAGMLIAAKFFANLTAEDDADGSRFAQDLYNMAIGELNFIRDGVVTIIGIDGNPIESSGLSATSFWPNATTDGPSFAVADVWS